MVSSISYAEVETPYGGIYARYQVRVMRHGRQYSKAFNCRHGKRKAYRKAKAYRDALIEALAADPLTSAGGRRDNRNAPHPFAVNYECDAYGTHHATVCYRSESGTWRRVSRSTAKSGRRKAAELARRTAKRRHVPAPRVRRKKMPSKAAADNAVIALAGA